MSTRKKYSSILNFPRVRFTFAFKQLTFSLNESSTGGISRDVGISTMNQLIWELQCKDIEHSNELLVINEQLRVNAKKINLSLTVSKIKSKFRRRQQRFYSFNVL